jgi:class 3 adenylate cyclase
MSSALRHFAVGLIVAVRFAFSAACVLLVLAYAAVFLAEITRVPALHSHFMARLTAMLSPSIHMVSSWFGWHWPRGAAVNYAPLIWAGALLVLRAVIDNAASHVAYDLRTLTAEQAMGRNETQAIHNQRLDVPLGARYTATVETEQQRAALLKRFREIEEALKSAQNKKCTFLSIDVVDSTGMKTGETETAISATFQAYEEMVRGLFASHGVWKQTWTPDGVMACFLDRELGLRAAQRVLMSLETFNRDENQLRTPVRVRCGLNEGEVPIFEDTPMEKVVHQVVDIAGHMQKHADPDSIFLSYQLYKDLGDPPGFQAAGKEVDGLEAYGWYILQSRPAEQQAAAAEKA